MEDISSTGSKVRERVRRTVRRTIGKLVWPSWPWWMALNTYGLLALAIPVARIYYLFMYLNKARCHRHNLNTDAAGLICCARGARTIRGNHIGDRTAKLSSSINFAGSTKLILLLYLLIKCPMRVRSPHARRIPQTRWRLLEGHASGPWQVVTRQERIQWWQASGTKVAGRAGRRTVRRTRPRTPLPVTEMFWIKRA